MWQFPATVNMAGEIRACWAVFAASTEAQAKRMAWQRNRGHRSERLLREMIKQAFTNSADELDSIVIILQLFCQYDCDDWAGRKVQNACVVFGTGEIARLMRYNRPAGSNAGSLLLHC